MEKYMTQNILEKMEETPLLFDGAMGTRIYEKGVFINTCYDELNLTNPALIEEIHREYVEAGVDAIETNSFGANRFRLEPHGLGEKVVEINTRSVEIARQAAGPNVFIIGSVGPCLRPGLLIEGDVREKLLAAFREQIQALVKAGAHAIQLETYTNMEELALGASVAKAEGVPVFASCTVDENGESALGAPIEDLTRKMRENSDIDAIGVNCGTGPAALCDVLKRMVELTDKPIILLPNAGLPRKVEDRMIYMTSPEYFSEYAKRYIQLGARAVGGCCGTRPDHIHQAGKAIRVLTGVKKHIEIQEIVEPEEDIKMVPLAEKSRLANRLAQGIPVRTIEILPPRSVDLSQMLEKAKSCYYHGIDAINIPDGPRASSRVSPMIASLAIKDAVGIEPILHYCCRDRNLIGMQADLMGGYAAGIANILIVTGDPPKLGDYPDATGVFDVDAVGLCRAVSNLNRGQDVGGNRINPPTGICVGVGANPCAIDEEKEIAHYQNKLNAGAEFAITQPVFSAEHLFRFLDRLDSLDRQIPVIAGLWPFTSYKNAQFMANEVPGVVVPEHVLKRMEKTTTREEGRAEGVRITQEIRDAIAGRVAGFQVSAPFGNVDMALEVLTD